MDNINQASFECAAYTRMVPEINLHYDLMGGTKVIRSKDYLKAFPLEAPESLQNRKASSVLFNKYQKGVASNAGLILKRAPHLVKTATTSDEFLKVFNEHWKNIDRSGGHGTQFVAQFFENMFAGHAFIVVDAPEMIATDKAQLRKERWRPYWNIYRADQAINWRPTIFDNRSVLGQITFRKDVLIPDGGFGEKTIKEYKTYRLTPDGVAVIEFRHLENDKENDLVVYGKPVLIPDMMQLPIAIGYGRQTGLAESCPPMTDLAYQNIRHYQKESDYDKADAYAGIVFMIAKGEVAMPGVGHDMLIRCEALAEFDLKETTGEALGAKRALLDRIENQMDELGLGLLLDKTQTQLTATQAMIDNTQKTSELTRIANSGKDAVNKALRFHADFMGVSEEDVPEIDLGFKADSLVLSAQTAQMLLDAAKERKLSVFDFLNTLKLGGAMPDSFVVEEGLQRLLEETERVLDTSASSNSVGEMPAS